MEQGFVTVDENVCLRCHLQARRLGHAEVANHEKGEKVCFLCHGPGRPRGHGKVFDYKDAYDKAAHIEK